MNDYFGRILFVLIPAFLALMYGLILVVPKAHGLYYRMSVMALACLFFGHLSYFILIVTGNSFDANSNIGQLGGLGCTMFLYAQNMKSMTSAMYDPRELNKVSRPLALIPSAVIAVTYVFAEYEWYKGSAAHPVSYWIGIVGSFAVISFINGMTSYTSFRFAVIQDEEDGFARAMRPYNITLTCFLLMTTFEKYVRYSYSETPLTLALVTLFYVLFAANILLLLPMQERGRSRFLTSLSSH